MDDFEENGCDDECCLKCGNGVLDPDEECDANEEYCLPGCKVKKGYECFNHAAGFVYCLPVCGDGIQTKEEACDSDLMIEI